MQAKQEGTWRREEVSWRPEAVQRETMYAEGRCHVSGRELALGAVWGESTLLHGTEFRVKWAVEVFCSEPSGLHDRTNRTEDLHD